MRAQWKDNFWLYVERLGLWLQAQAQRRIGTPPAPIMEEWGASDDGRVVRMSADEARRSG